MTRWSAALTQAGITDPQLRRSYDVQRKLVRRNRREEYLAVRLLLPARIHPGVIAAVAFMDETDRRIDSGDIPTRQDALRTWDRQATEALAGEPTENETLRALADTARRYPVLNVQVRHFLDGAPVEATWSGFATDADFQDYVDRYSLPALMLTASLIGPEPGTEHYERFLHGCRRLIEAMQRTDFLADLAEDVDQGRVGVPKDELDRHGLGFDSLRDRPEECAPALARLVDEQAARADAVLSECRRLPELVAPPYRPFLSTLISVQTLRLDAVKRNSTTILRTGASPATSAALRVLWRGYRTR
ncbi:phytoene/squalene synthase family protein [Streptomyces justiciae]|uniref:Squalene/phytoene synthase family protein n=1 Tax=Streptomyces justiciae TaxID=2780140 RepID=A0ABU3LKK8_9ACTN|nr:squalene/phytoene synthase family protein [Streptomyces justiciae]MDT7839776.1 squalene/phytoene synthase family protein [Streptomyces justiciae]